MRQVELENQSDLIELGPKGESPMSNAQISNEHIPQISLESPQTRNQSQPTPKSNRKLKKIYKIKTHLRDGQISTKHRKNHQTKRNHCYSQQQTAQNKSESIQIIQYERILINKNSAFKQNQVLLCPYHLSIADAIFSSSQRKHFVCHNWRCIISRLDYYELSLQYKLEFGYMGFAEEHQHFRTRKSPFSPEPEDEKAGGFFDFIANHDQAKKWSAANFRRFSSSLRNQYNNSFTNSLQKGEQPLQLTEAGLHLLSIFRQSDPKARQILEKCSEKLAGQRQYIINLKNINNNLELERQQQAKMKEENERVDQNNIIYDVTNLQLGLPHFEESRNPLHWDLEEESR